MSDIMLQQPDGKWCLFSTITDSFVIEDAAREEILGYKVEKYRERMDQKLSEIEQQGGDWYNPPQSYEDLVELSQLNDE
jgi:hypothetical protein